MKALLEFDGFRTTYEAGKAQVVSTRLVADLETPVSAFLKLGDGRRYACLFESVEGGTTIGRYSFIGLKPDLIWRCRGEKAEINRIVRRDLEAFEPETPPALESLQRLIEESRIDLPGDLPPMAACLLGYMGYDTVRLMERLPDDNPDALGVPTASSFARR